MQLASDASGIKRILFSPNDRDLIHRRLCSDLQFAGAADDAEAMRSGEQSWFGFHVFTRSRVTSLFPKASPRCYVSCIILSRGIGWSHIEIMHKFPEIGSRLKRAQGHLAAV